MSDLISRSDLNKEIESIYLNVSGMRSGKGILAKCMDLYKKAVLEIINNQPTAFDKEKVVEDLEQLKIETKKNNYKAYFALDVAIDIVRKGGIE